MQTLVLEATGFAVCCLSKLVERELQLCFLPKNIKVHFAHLPW